MEIKKLWASKPNWVKDGVLGVVFILIYFILFNTVLSQLFLDQAELLSTPFASPFYLIWGLLDLIPIKDMRLITPSESMLIMSTSFLALFAVYFLIGSLAGWIIRKIKK